MPTGRKRKDESAKKEVRITESAMKLHDGSPLILFDEHKEEMKLPLLGIDEKALAPPDDAVPHSLHRRMCGFAECLRNGQVPSSMHDTKMFLRMSSIKFHFLASHLAMTQHDQKCTRNQVKRAYTLMSKESDSATRQFIRLMLEILRCGSFTEGDAAKKSAAEKAKGTPEKARSSRMVEEKQIASIFQYLKTMMTTSGHHGDAVTRHNVLPFIALCAVYAYCTVDDAVIRNFKREDGGGAVPHDKEQVVRRRITFLQFMIGQLLQQRTPGGYTWAILSAAIYLYQLMGRCDDYDLGKKDKMKGFLTKWLPRQWEFVNRELADCPPAKRAVARMMMGFEESMDHEDGVDVATVIRALEENCEEKDVAALDDQMGSIKKAVTNHYNHIFVAKSAKK